MNAESYAVILAGGNGERLWPLSTPGRPKQFVDLFGGKPLIRHAVDRLEGLIPPERVLVITAERLVALTREALPGVPAENIIGEPCRRDTAAAVAVACGLVMRLGGPDAVGCILTADQLIDPAEKFRRTLGDAIEAAAKTGAIVTMGIVPTYPATGFGYIESGAQADLGTATRFDEVVRFVEKPDAATAERYLATGRFSWNAGMFIWKASAMKAEFEANAPDIAKLIGKVAESADVAGTLASEYPSIRAISVDYAVMEKTRNILVAKSEFGWDDVGSWLAIPGRFGSDGEGNTRIGRTAVLGTSGSIVVSDGSHLTAVLGMEDVVVVHTADATLVCPKSRLGELKSLVKSL
ncbi:MAG: mannose-1-phosphate guanylyltransferase [Kiritimatiellae bacterium]|nr:mannose-1-phosphate guanylyltransferase [Kiritimatiellia bacterium]